MADSSTAPPDAPPKPNAWAALRIACSEPRVLAVLALGFASGLPLSLTGATLAAWLTDAKVDRGAIGLFAAVGTPYALKFLWAPLIDRLPLPWASRVIGRRRAWLLLTEILLVLSLIWLGRSDPGIAPWRTAAAALCVAISSASQDIVIDAYRVELLPLSLQAAGAAAVQFGYRLAMLVSGAGALALATWLPWVEVYAMMAALISIGAITTLLAGEPTPPLADRDHKADRDRRLASRVQALNALSGAVIAWIYGAVVAPFADFMTRPRWLAILAFIVLYKLGDAFAGVMTTTFLLQIGFTKLQLAAVVKVFGFGATILGLILGGAMMQTMGPLKGLMVAGIAQMLTNLIFVAQALIGPDPLFLTLAVSAENFAGGIGSALFVAYLSGLCTVAYTATQYALLSSLSAVARTWLSAPGGYLADWAGWPAFFIFSALLSLPGLALIPFLRRTMLNLDDMQRRI